MDEDPSFSIGITQLNSSNTRRIYDSNDDKWAKNRSKLLHDPLAMKNQNIDKANKEVPSSSKVNVEPPPKWGEKQHRQFSNLHYLKDCRLFVAAFAEFLSDEIHISANEFRSDYLHK
ncbi:hypothetical protein H5410_047191 [Solanum commersonii]|uniref:Ulp1 protease family, C-terminal catalytic domain containing protein n=1 Tax=Solanum commersonii TaxID=4109 RepID=A0A9J5XGE0_SOLCO|nr:hypothetical protein H5410_047191 [Solanum commersonii]